MNAPQYTGYLQLVFLLVFIIPVIFFFLTQQRTLEQVRPANRRMQPGMVWLQFVPLFGLVWQFVVVTKIADSIRDEFNSPQGDSVLGEDDLYTSERPTHIAGVSYAALVTMTIFFTGTLKGFIALAGLVVWVVYWIQLVQYKKKLKERSLTSN